MVIDGIGGRRDGRKPWHSCGDAGELVFYASLGVLARKPCSRATLPHSRWLSRYRYVYRAVSASCGAGGVYAEA